MDFGGARRSSCAFFHLHVHAQMLCWTYRLDFDHRHHSDVCTHWLCFSVQCWSHFDYLCHIPQHSHHFWGNKNTIWGSRNHQSCFIGSFPFDFFVLFQQNQIGSGCMQICGSIRCSHLQHSPGANHPNSDKLGDVGSLHRCSSLHHLLH